MNDMAKALDQLMVTHKYLKPEVIQEWNYTPEDILEALTGIEYAYLNKSGKRVSQIREGDFYDQYVLQSPSQVWLNKFGVCWDVVELSRLLFLSTGLEFVPISLRLCPGDGHTFITFKRNKKFYIFEYSFGDYRGIHGSFNSIPQVIDTVVGWMLHEWRGIDVGLRYATKHPIMKSGIGCQEFMDVAHRAPKVPGVKTLNVMFHGSPITGLRKLGTDYDVMKEINKRINATTNIIYASIYTIRRGDPVLVENTSGHYFQLTVPKEIEAELLQPASIYLLATTGEGWQCKGYDPNDNILSSEFYTTKPSVKVVKELRFKTARECMETYGVKIIIK